MVFGHCLVRPFWSISTGGEELVVAVEGVTLVLRM